MSNLVWQQIGKIGTDMIFSKLQAQRKAEMEKASYLQAAMQHKYQAETAGMNAQMAAMERNMKMAAMEQQAFSIGLRDAQAMAATRVSQAGSGVLMDSASTYEVRASEKFVHSVNQANLNLSRAQAEAAANMNIANFRASRLVSLGNMHANNILAAAIDPDRIGWTSALIGGAQSAANMPSATGGSVAGDILSGIGDYTGMVGGLFGV